MDTSRRLVMKALAASGVIGPALRARADGIVSGTASGMAVSDDPSAPSGSAPSGTVVALLGDSGHDAAFLDGLTASLPVRLAVLPVRVDLVSSGAGGLRALRQVLSPGAHVRVVGFLDDGEGAAALSLAREAGARIGWLGYHQAASGTQSRHRVVTADAFRRGGSRLSDALQAGGCDYRVSEHGAGDTEVWTRNASSPLSPSAAGADWAFALGLIVGSGLGPPRQDAGQAVPAASRPQTRAAFTSFALTVPAHGVADV